MSERFAFMQTPLSLAGAFLLPLLCNAEPYEPAGGDTVLMTLSPALQNHWQQPAAVAELSAEQRLTQARLLVNDARERGNNDAYGQAEALLQTLTTQALGTQDNAALMAEAWYLMAYIRQHNHEFPAALTLLDQLLAQYPTHHAARLQRAQINLVSANYAAAREDCQALAYRISNALVASCAAQVSALTGQAEQASLAMQQMLASSQFSTDEKFELQLTQATVAEQLGNDERALSLYRELLGISADNEFVLQHLADLYLRNGDAAEAAALIAARLDENSSLELRVTLLQALLATGEDTRVAPLREQLSLLFAAAQARGQQDFPHKEYARFALHILHDSSSALQAARRNWRVQKEPGDLLLLTQAAAAANDAQALAEVRQWLQTRGLQDQRIAQALQFSADLQQVSL